ncbi:AAA family ATPase [Pseudomonas asplenii]|uniref:AAA family ATPase n=1 Tax=Pseudomonas asplenii TaxID=53407 RepID=UPI002234E055|nr:AAA family ATPase [Pseudomonas asplenii]UZE31138.1 AAA family ATPase [Pseudomonas asplenii]
MLIHSVQLANFLSFGASSPPIPLKSLNVIIGPNGSGKSNLLESIELLRSAPEQLSKPVRESGGVRDWLWKGTKGTPIASLDFVIAYPNGPQNLRYRLSFTEAGQRFEMVDERIENEKPDGACHAQPYLFYHFNSGRPVLSLKGGGSLSLQVDGFDLEKSILSQRRDPDQYPEVTYLGRALGKIRLYREWSFGRDTASRLPQMLGLPSDVLEPDCSNLGLVLNRLRRDPAIKQRLLTALQVLYGGIDDYDVRIEGGTVQVFFHEEGMTVPATRLSGGALRYLCLLAVLFHPNPPPLICIEEPEFGLHPDILPTLAQLLKEASARTQLIVTTHSDVLLDALSDQPESVLVAEKTESGTTLTRLNAEKLKPLLETYRLGQLWTRGEIGGTRW